MSLVKSGQIANCCAPNALMTLQEYLEDYASPETKEKGIREIAKAIEHIPNPKIKAIATKRLEEIRQGLDIRTISEQVMQQLFKVLAMHFEFSLQGIEKANITKTEGIK